MKIHSNEWICNEKFPTTNLQWKLHYNEFVMKIHYNEFAMKIHSNEFVTKNSLQQICNENFTTMNL